MEAFWFILGLIVMALFALTADYAKSGGYEDQEPSFASWLQHRSPTFYAWLAIVCVLLIVCSLLFIWGVDLLNPNGEEELSIEDLRNLLLGFGAVLAAPVGLLTLANGRQRNRIFDAQKEIALKQENNESQRLSADVFSRAVELLAQTETTRQLGGTYTLQKLFQSADEQLRIQIVDTLNAHVKLLSSRAISEEDDTSGILVSLDASIKVVLQLASQLKDYRLDMSGTYLSNISEIDIGTASVMINEAIFGSLTVIANGGSIRMFNINHSPRLRLEGGFEKIEISNSKFQIVQGDWFGPTTFEYIWCSGVVANELDIDGLHMITGSQRHSFMGINTYTLKAHAAKGWSPRLLASIGMQGEQNIRLPEEWDQNRIDEFYELKRGFESQEEIPF